MTMPSTSTPTIARTKVRLDPQQVGQQQARGGQPVAGLLLMPATLSGIPFFIITGDNKRKCFRRVHS
jgi:hypothetical protein